MKSHPFTQSISILSNRPLQRARLGIGSALVTTALLFCPGCADEKSKENASIKITDVQHTPVKRQSIGNCWLYGEATWLESLLKSYTHADVNVSESYWTWWHWYDQLTKPDFSGKKLETGGGWSVAGNIILRHGWVLTGEFIPSEAGSEMSQKQADALALVNRELGTGGRLDTAAKRSPATVEKVLDEAFSSHMSDVAQLARSARKTFIGEDEQGSISLKDALAGSSAHRWVPALFPDDEAGRRETLTRVFTALNDYHPVVMDINIDFNAMDRSDNGSFRKRLLDAAGKPGTQGGHVVVLKDYLVENVPGYGTLGRGDLPAAEKAAALKGDLVALIAKNSWGVKRSDRGMVDGYTTFYKDYLYGPIAWKEDEESANSPTAPVTPLEFFMLPPGY